MSFAASGVQHNPAVLDGYLDSSWPDYLVLERLRGHQRLPVSGLRVPPSTVHDQLHGLTHCGVLRSPLLSKKLATSSATTQCLEWSSAAPAGTRLSAGSTGLAANCKADALVALCNIARYANKASHALAQAPTVHGFTHSCSTVYAVVNCRRAMS